MMDLVSVMNWKDGVFIAAALLLCVLKIWLHYKRIEFDRRRLADLKRWGDAASVAAHNPPSSQPYRDPAPCERCVVLEAKIAEMEAKATSVLEVFPYQGMDKDGNCYCRLCGVGVRFNAWTVVACEGWRLTWYGKRTRRPECPNEPHTHRTCKRCRGTFLEAPPTAAAFATIKHS